MGTKSYHARRNAGLCGSCGEVESQPSRCEDCKAIARIKREDYHQANPFCACKRHRIQIHSEFDRCWHCRMEMGFYVRKPVVRTDETRRIHREVARRSRQKVRAEKALRPQQPALRAVIPFNAYPKVSLRATFEKKEGPCSVGTRG